MKLGRTTVALLLAAPVPLAMAPPAHAAELRCRGEVATIVGTSHRDTLTGTPGADVIVGRGGRDIIDAGGGDDVVCGGTSADTIDGGDGDDRISGNRGDDRLRDREGDDRVSGGRGRKTDFLAGAGDDVLNDASNAPSFEFGPAPGPVTVDLAAGTATGFGSDILRFAPGAQVLVSGSRFGDTLLGSSGHDTLWGAGGVDTIDGRGGGDNLVATDGALTGGDGGDGVVLLHTGTVDGGAGDDQINATGEVTSVDGGADDDRVVLEAEGAVATSLPDLSGGDGHDSLRLSVLLQRVPKVPFSFDLASGALGFGDYATTTPGFEDLRLFGDASSFDLTGTDGPNHIELIAVNLQAATLRGLGGDDHLIGSGGDDVIDGGPGSDVADGRDGNDSCTGVESRTSCETVTP
jgi:Ca2+-binding RTX toxin-like protein